MIKEPLNWRGPKVVLPFLLFTIPAAAFMDTYAIREHTFLNYLILCTWEVMIFLAGYAVGGMGIEIRKKKR